MARILVTGSADGLGRATAESLVAQGHEVVVHARNESLAVVLKPLLDRGAELAVADFADRSQVLAVANELNDRPPLDGIVHNAGVIGGPDLLAVNVVAPYLLTALLPGPRRHVYLSSGMHRGGRASLTGIDWGDGRSTASYSDSKLFVTALSMAVARLRPDLVSNAVDPGWVPTRMGGAGAPDDFELGHETQELLVTDDSPISEVSGGYWYHGKQQSPHRSTLDEQFQDELLTALATETGVTLPTA
jgi:NAD(P)-dependent dehydrogenase (short-subunit alcohol dehydrogenase family)